MDKAENLAIEQFQYQLGSADRSYSAQVSPQLLNIGFSGRNKRKEELPFSRVCNR